jgi:hypothetical protein
MSCCGQRRREIASVATVSAPAQRPKPYSQVALFEYIGTTAMTVAGPISGVRYRFGSPGSKLRVDSRDAPSMSALPNLRRLE